MKIYRGERIKDANADRVRVLKQCLREGVTSDFVNGGDPYIIQQLGFLGTVAIHIANDRTYPMLPNWKLMLSFSSDPNKAKHYAGGTDNDSLIDEDLSSQHSMGNLEEGTWEYTDHLIFELDITNKRAEPGPEFAYILPVNGGRNKILLLDSVKYLTLELDRHTYLKGNDKTLLETALQNAQRDSEWLVMSLDLIPHQEGFPPSVSAIIKHCDELKIVHYLEPDWIHR